MGIKRKISSAISIWRRDGLVGVRNHFKLLKRVADDQQRYERWLLKHGTLNENKRREIRSQIAAMKSRPLISIVLPVYADDDIWLRQCINSVRGQLYENWELCIGEDCSPVAAVRNTLNEMAAYDSRVKICFRPENGNISAASNSALDLATGDFTALLDHDDELSEDALFWLAREIEMHPDASVIYSDEDMLDVNGVRSKPTFKPDWSPDLMYSLNMLNHLTAYRTSVVRQIGGFRLGAEGSQDYDLALRVIEKIRPDQIRHIPRILYHWRAIEGSVAYGSEEKPYAHERAREAIREHFGRLGIKATVEKTQMNRHRVRYTLPNVLPKVTVLLHGDADEGEISRLASGVDYDGAEFKIITTGTNSAEILNKAVADSEGEILVFLSKLASPTTGDWLMELPAFALQPEIGAVGGRILDSELRVWDGGIILGTSDLLSVAHGGLPSNFPGNISRNQVICNYSAVSVSCLAMRREVFEKVGGFDSEHFPGALFDVDLCLRLGERGYRIVLDPYVDFTCNKNFERQKPSAIEEKYFRQRWHQHIRSDPFYNPNLSRLDGAFTVEV